MDRKKTPIFAVILAASAAACACSSKQSTPFIAEQARLRGSIPPGWNVADNGPLGTLLVYPEFIERECPNVSLSRLERPVTEEYARRWHEIEAHPIPGRNNIVDPLNTLSVAGMKAWSFTESATVYSDPTTAPRDHAPFKPVRVRFVTYLVQSPGPGIKIKLSAPEVIFDRFKPQLDQILASLKPSASPQKEN